jgi:hypothetical protein
VGAWEADEPVGDRMNGLVHPINPVSWKWRCAVPKNQDEKVAINIEK